MMRTWLAKVVILGLMGTLAGCANMSSREQRMLSGGAIGAGAGAVIGGATGGSPAAGAVIGGAAGAAGGYIVDETQKDKE
jgi:hypothetical protein